MAKKRVAPKRFKGNAPAAAEPMAPPSDYMIPRQNMPQGPQMATNMPPQMPSNPNLPTPPKKGK